MLRSRLLPLLLCLLGIPTMASSQSGKLVGKALDPHLYDDIKNSPYIFPRFLPAILVPLSGNPITGVAVNFNGNTQVFELEKDGLRMEMEIGRLMGVQVQVTDSVCGFPTFLKLLNPKLINKFPLFLYQGSRYKLLKDFRATLAENKVESPGKTIKFKSFNPITTYYLLEGKDLEPVKLGRSDFLKRFPGNEVAAFVEAEGLTLETEQEVCRLLYWLENRGH